MGRKRKHGASLSLAAACKRRRPEQASGGWASLPTDVVGLVTDRLLDVDSADYIVFRAVCSAWRACTPTPGERDPRHRPRGWIALCDADAIRPDVAGEVAMFNPRTARCLRARLPPKLRGYRIVCFSDGLLVLLHKRDAVVKVLNPLTRAAVDFPSLASVYHEFVKHMYDLRAMNAAVCMTSSSIAVVVWFPSTPVVVAAEAGSDHWEIVHRNLCLNSTLLFQERLYGTLPGSESYVIIQVYPRRPPPLGHVVADVPSILRDRGLCGKYLVELGGRMLLVLCNLYAPRTCQSTRWWQQLSFRLYEVDLSNNSSSNPKLTPVSCIGERALFLSKNGCFSISARALPSLSSNSIYFSARIDPALMYSLTTGLSEELAAECQIHDRTERIRPSVRPFTIADHLLTFCNQHEWTKGLMFHEYYFIPGSFKELWKKIKAKEWQLQTPRLHPPPTRIKVAQAESKDDAARRLIESS
ncbi:unnamed protein product [Alopecurus aequalis]